MAQEKQPGIQIARAIAALGIVYYHSWVSIFRFPQDTAYPIPGLKQYGWLSVDLFFAISGFVICLVVDRRSFDTRSFLIKRVFRLYPLWLTMLTMFAATAWLWRGFTPRETPAFFLYSATLLPTTGLPFYDVGWTLQHEIIFYLIAAVTVRYLGLRGLAAVLLASAIASHLTALPWPFAKLAAHHAEFLAGVLAFLVRGRMARFGFLLPFAIGASLFVFFVARPELGLLPIALFILIVAFANFSPTELAWWSKPLVVLGDASYSMYLIHPMVFLVASAVVSRLPNAPLWTQEPIRFGCIAVVICLALASWRFFEGPLIRFGNRIAARSGKGSIHAAPMSGPSAIT